MKMCCRKSGFTLIEVLVTLVVVAIGLASILPMLSAGIFGDSSAADITIALNLAQEKMEEVRASATYAGIDGFASAKSGLGGDFSRFQREVTVASDPKEVNVIIYWEVRGPEGEHSLTLASLFADYDY